MMRPIRLKLRWLAGCAAGLSLSSCAPGWPPPWPPPWVAPVGALAVAEVASIVVLHRGILDTLISTFSGRDCSIVYLDRGQSYCRTPEPPPPPPPYCTRSLGVVDCWINPEALVTLPPQVANGPTTLTPAQETDRTRRWPAL